MKRAVATALLAVVTLTLWALPAQAVAFTGLVSPTIIGGLADLNGSGTITAADTWRAFYGDTDIIAGGLDCNAWTAPNDGTAGDGVINADDDCILIGFDGTTDGVTVTVSNGHFVELDGAPITSGTDLPTVFNAADPDNPSVVAADFAWQVIGGRVDANGNGLIDDGDCSVGIVNGWNILGVECGFNPPSTSADNGLVDVTGDFVITTADDHPSGFFGLAVVDGFVQAGPVQLPGTPTVTHVSPVGGPTGTTVTLTGKNLAEATVTVCGIQVAVTSNTGTSLTFNIPASLAEATCPIIVTTAQGEATASFIVTAENVLQARAVTIRDRHRGDNLILRGRVFADVPECFAQVPVRVQRKRAGGWRTIGTDLTNDNGAYRERVTDRVGRYRTVAPEFNTDGQLCLKAVSPVLRHRH